jgi:tol-pal system protein YbgF
MLRYGGAAWVFLLLMLGGALPTSISHAQRPSDQALTLELLQRIERLELEVRNMRGELEVQRYQLDLLQQDQAAAVNPAVAPGTVAPAAPPPTAATQPATPAVSETDQAGFDAAMAQWRAGRYPEAISAWRRFLDVHSNSPLAGDAQYWLGEAYYASRDYNAAKDAFIALGLNDPQSARLPDALLRLGYIYRDLGDLNRARDVLQKLVQVYPSTQAASLAEQQLQSLR